MFRLHGRLTSIGHLVRHSRSQALLGNASIEALLRYALATPDYFDDREAELPSVRSQAELGNEGLTSFSFPSGAWERGLTGHFVRSLSWRAIIWVGSAAPHSPAAVAAGRSTHVLVLVVMRLLVAAAV